SPPGPRRSLPTPANLRRGSSRHLDDDGPRLRRPPDEADSAAVAEAQVEGAGAGELAPHREPALLADAGDARRVVPSLRAMQAELEADPGRRTERRVHVRVAGARYGEKLAVGDVVHAA